jgi:16S rRNA (adenine(1408)-N(1))-methyltransferase
MTSMTRVMRPGAALSVVLSATDRDRGAGVPAIDEHILHALSDRYGGHGLTVTEVRRATEADVAATHSTWGKRLAAGRNRPAWLLRATKSGLEPLPLAPPRRYCLPAT